MPDTYADFRREPSKPHQCMHYSDEDGTRCRSIAMHGEHMCYHHQSDTILPVIENEPFLLETLDTRDDIQRALGQVARQLACNRMDFERARLLVHILTAAMRNLPPHPRPRAAAPQPTQTIPTEGSTKAGAPHLASEMWVPQEPTSTPAAPNEAGCRIYNSSIVMGGVAAAPDQPATDNLQPATPLSSTSEQLDPGRRNLGAGLVSGEKLNAFTDVAPQQGDVERREVAWVRLELAEGGGKQPAGPERVRALKVVEGDGDLDQALEEQLLRLRGGEPDAFPGFVRGEELAGVVMTQPLGERAVDPIEGHGTESSLACTGRAELGLVLRCYSIPGGRVSDGAHCREHLRVTMITA